MSYEKYSEKKSFPWLLIITFVLVITAVVFVILAFGGQLGSLFKKDDKKSAETTSSISSQQDSQEVEKLVKEPEDSWRLLLVNFENSSGVGFKPPELADINDTVQVDSRMVVQLKDMIATARKEQCFLEVISGFRTYEKQTVLYNQEVKEHKAEGKSQEVAEADAAKEVAKPGYSEHITGLAIDIVYGNWYKQYTQPNEHFAESKEFEWLQDHAHEYGFIMRFAKDKTDITGVSYEPWHYRYVGVKNATAIKEEGITLEEYLKKFQE